MFLDNTITKYRNDFLKALKEERAKIDRQIGALVGFTNNTPVETAPRVKRVHFRNIDVRPTIKEIFSQNGNQAMRMMDLQRALAQRHPELTKTSIRRKMIYAVKPQVGVLVKEDYGQYRVNPTIIAPAQELVTA